MQKKTVSTRNEPAFVPKWSVQASVFAVLWRAQECVGLDLRCPDMILTDGNSKCQLPELSL